ncbi:MAG: YDG domain-containing protein, partial [Fibromonadaceae bacterium]|nr:YDG domain-containing protein [Fibromonadaceae bacterium]
MIISRFLSLFSRSTVAPVALVAFSRRFGESFLPVEHGRSWRFGKSGVQMLAVLLAVMASGAWAQIVNVGADMGNTTFYLNETQGNSSWTYCVGASGSQASRNCQLSLDGQIITITSGDWTLTGITGFRTVVVNPANGETINLTLDDVSVASGVRPPLTITYSGGNVGSATVNLLIKRGENSKSFFTAGGRGAAGIYLASNRVTTNIRDADGDGPSGELHAKGAGAVSARSAGVLPTGGGAGIGANGAYREGTTNHAASSFGSLTIEGGKVFATGGQSIGVTTGNCSNANNSSCGGAGAGIGGGGAFDGGAYVAQSATTSGGSITISGGTVVVKGGAWRGASAYGNGIGNGGQVGETADVIAAFSGTPPTLNITGGSLTAVNGSDVPFAGGIGLTVTGLARRHIQLSSNNTARNKNVTEFTRTTTDGVTNHTYGINGVYTDANSSVYFWLPTATTITPADSITLDRKYGYRSGENPFLFQPLLILPKISPPLETPNSHVGVDANITGPYATGFRMAVWSQRAAVGRLITLYKGDRYVANDGRAEAAGNVMPTASGGRAHLVRWYRTDGLHLGEPTNRELITERNGGRGFISAATGLDTDTYTPSSADYGKYIWAEVLAMDDNDLPTNAQVFSETEFNEEFWEENAVRYPVIQVGVVINAVPTLHSSVVGLGEPSVSITQFGVTPPGSLFMDLNLFSVSAIASLGERQGLDYVWRVMGEDPFIPIISLENNIVNPLVFTIPANVAITGDITLEVEIRDGSRPQLRSIDICRIDDLTCDNSVSQATVVTATNSAQLSGAIPKQGIIKLTFNSRPVNLINPVTGGDLIGRVFLSEPGAAPIQLSCVYAGDVGAVVLCSYPPIVGAVRSSLESGKTYALNVRDFVNEVNNQMVNFATDITVERKSSVEWEGYAEEVLLVGGQLRGDFAHAGFDGGAQTKLSWYFEVYSDTTNASRTFKAEDDTDSIIGTRGSVTSDFPLFATTGASELTGEHFGKWVRLVIRSDGTASVDGDALGDAFFGPWMRVGVLLKPGVASGADIVECGELDGDGDFVEIGDGCPTFSNVILGQCDITLPEDIRATIQNCTKDGLVKYDNNPVMLGTTLDPIRTGKEADDFDFYKITNWTIGTNVATDNCESVLFNCGTFATFIVPSNPAANYTISPVVVKYSYPAIASLTLKNTQSDKPSELKEGGVNVEGTDIAIYDNVLSIIFDEIVHETTVSRVRLFKGTDFKDLTCSFAGTPPATSGTTCTADLDLLDEGFLSFDTGYRLVVSGYENNHKDRMQTETFFFTTASKASIEAGTLSSNILGNAGRFAVGHEIVANTSKYIKNGGKDLVSYSFCWYHGDTMIESSCDESNGGTDTDQIEAFVGHVAKYTPGSSDFNKNIHLKITVKDEGNTESTYDTPPVHVGVLLKIDPAGFERGTETVPGPSFGANASAEGLTARIGTHSHAVSTGTGVVVYEATAIRVISDRPSQDKFLGWNFTGTLNGSFGDAKEASTEWLPNNPGVGVTLIGSMTDGTTPSIIVSRDESKFTLSFDKPVTSTDASTEVHIVERNTSTPKFVYAVDAQTLTTLGTTLDIPFASFVNGTITFALETEKNYVLTIEEGAFEDGFKNETSKTTFNFSGTGAYYAAKLDQYSIIVPKTYDRVVEKRTITLTNLSSQEITVEHSLTGDDAADFTVIVDRDIMDGKITVPNSNNDNDGTVVFTITLDSLDAKRYEASLIITPSDGIQQFTVPITFIVDKKEITIEDHITLKEDSRVYDGTPYVDLDDKWEWGGFEKVKVGNDYDDVDVITFPAGQAAFTNSDVGSNKAITVTYAIKGDDGHNYILATPTHELFGAITQRPISVNFPDENFPGDEKYLGYKFYDGSDVLEDVDAKLYKLGCPHGITVDCGKASDDDDVELADIIFYLNNAHAGENKTFRDITGHLTGMAAKNYSFQPINRAGLTADVKRKSLAHLANSDKYMAANCVINATATYGQKVADLRADGSCDVEDEGAEGTGQTVMGRWEIQEDGDLDIGTVSAPRQLSVRYMVAGLNINFENDLVVNFKPNVNPAEVLLIADLSEAGNGIREYDDTYVLEGVKLAGLAEQDPPVSSELLACLTADAKFVNRVTNVTDVNVGDGKRIVITWKPIDEDECEAVIGNYRISQTTVQGGMITPRRLHLASIEVEDKDFDGNRNATFIVGSTPTLRTDAGTALAATKSVSLNQNHITATFVSANVNLVDGAAGPVAVVLGGFSLNGNEAGNFELVLESLEYSAIIRPIDLAGNGNNLDLRQRGIYGDALTDIRISTAASAAISWPSALAPPVTVVGVSSVSGSWEWIDGSVGEATYFDGMECPSVSNDAIYTNEAMAKFTPFSPNYNALEVPVKLCVAPYQLRVGTPAIVDNGSKVYDGNVDFKKNITVNSNWKIAGFVAGDARADNSGLNLIVEKASYNKKDASTSQDYDRELTVYYGLTGTEMHNYIAPDPFVMRNAEITPRPVTVKVGGTDGLKALDRYYQAFGDNVAVVTSEKTGCAFPCAVPLEGITGVESGVVNGEDVYFNLNSDIP